MSSKSIESFPKYKLAISVLSEMAEECPSCGSPDIFNDENSGQVGCRDCKSLFDIENATKKSQAVKRLRQEGFEEMAERVQSMSGSEYADFLKNYVL